MLGSGRFRGYGRGCRRCGAAIQAGGVRQVGPHTYCGEVCAILALMEEASRTAWALAALELSRAPRGPRRRMRVALARWRATAAQRRLDRRLDAGPRAEGRRRVWSPSLRVWRTGSPPRWAAAGLALVLLAWGAASWRGPETRGTGHVPATSPAVQASLAIPSAPTEGPTPPPVTREASIPQGTSPAIPGSPPQEDPAAWREDFTQGSRAIREVAFTFDGHDEANVAGEILDMLRAKDVHVTMFLTGQFIRAFPDLVRRMVGDGHEIGSHLDSHPHLTSYARNHRHETLPGVTREFVTGELRRAEASFRALTGRPMAPYWRAPYGEHNAEIRAWAAAAGYRHIGWTRGAGAAEDLDTRDWVADTSSRIYRSQQEIATRILEFGRGRPGALNGGIVLMHLATHRRADRPHEALPHLLKSLQGQGYRVVPVSTLLAQAAPHQAQAGPAGTLRAAAWAPPQVR